MEHGTQKYNRGGERLAIDHLGQTNQSSLYKWMANGRLPLCLVVPLEKATGSLGTESCESSSGLARHSDPPLAASVHRCISTLVVDNLAEDPGSPFELSTPRLERVLGGIPQLA